MTIFRDKITAGLAQNSITLTDDQIEKFEKHRQSLLEYNEHTNITRITNEEDMAIKHYIDSILPLKYLDEEDLEKLIVDVGTGAGFPGIPWKILKPTMRISLCDSVLKKTKFLEIACDNIWGNSPESKANKPDIIRGRIEDILYTHRIEVLVLRAVSDMSKFVNLIKFRFRKEIIIYFLKGPNCIDEIENIKTIEDIECIVEKTIEYSLPFTDEKRVLIKLRLKK